MPPPEVPLPGYHLLHVLGRGAFADVWDAVRERDGSPVAVKVLRAPDPVSRLRFVREGKIARRIASPFVVTLLDTGTELHDPPFLVYEKLVGETLDARLEREGSLGLVEVWPLVRDVLAGLVAAHAVSVIHRDVKPANVFLDATNGRARLLDFGVAKAPDDNEDGPLRTTAGSTLGSLAYMAPEQAGGAGAVDVRADLYAVGAIAFRALAGRLPFGAKLPATMLALKLDRDAPTLREVTGALWPDSIETFLRSTLAREPKRRFRTAEAAMAGWMLAERAEGPA